MYIIICEFNLFQSDEVATAWLNDESVRKAIHAQPVNDFKFTCIFIF